MKAMRVSHYTLRTVGHGGFHRAYQIQHDLELTLGKENVVSFDNPWEYFPPRPKSGLGRIIRKTQEALARYAENPYNLLTSTPFSTKRFAFPRLLADYERAVSSSERPAVCVIEHAGFADILAINNRVGIPTIICPQNLESFDMRAFDHRNKREMFARAIDFANELRVLSECTTQLFISKVETGLASGLGLPARYYPYLPVGNIRERLETVRLERNKGNINPGLFLMIGTAGHDTTRASLSWFVQNAQSRGLPGGVQIIIVGLQTEQLLPQKSLVPGLELKGWVEQAELDSLLACARAVLIPQNSGFGAVTRLPELACAGIPIVVSRHATYAIEPLPGAEILDDVWDAWYAKIEQLSQSTASISPVDYTVWEEKQPRTLQDIIRKMNGGGAIDGPELRSTDQPKQSFQGASQEVINMVNKEPSSITINQATTEELVYRQQQELNQLRTEREQLLIEQALARQTLVDISRSRAYRLLRHLGRWKWLKDVIAQLPVRSTTSASEANEDIPHLSTAKSISTSQPSRPYIGFREMLRSLRARGLTCTCIFDIGANYGEWAQLARDVFPESRFILVEPQVEMEVHLQAFCRESPGSRYYLAGAGAVTGQLPLTIWSDLAGSSFLPAKSQKLLDEGTQRSVPIITINALLENEANLLPQIVKLDVQGFELEVLKGATKLFGFTEVFILEVALFEFLNGQPLFDEVITFMAKNGYVVYDLPECLRRPYDGALGQVDVCFTKRDGLLRANKQWQ